MSRLHKKYYYVKIWLSSLAGLDVLCSPQQGVELSGLKRFLVSNQSGKRTIWEIFLVENLWLNKYLCIGQNNFTSRFFLYLASIDLTSLGSWYLTSVSKTSIISLLTLTGLKIFWFLLRPANKRVALNTNENISLPLYSTTLLASACSATPIVSSSSSRKFSRSLDSWKFLS